MYFHWRTQRATGCLGEIVLKPPARCDLPEHRGSLPVDAASIVGLFARCRWN